MLIFATRWVTITNFRFSVCLRFMSSELNHHINIQAIFFYRWIMQLKRKSRCYRYQDLFSWKFVLGENVLQWFWFDTICITARENMTPRSSFKCCHKVHSEFVHVKCNHSSQLSRMKFVFENFLPCSFCNTNFHFILDE